MSTAEENDVFVHEDRLQDASTPNGSGILPDGYIDEHGVRHRDFILREMSGVEEDLLASIVSKKSEPYSVFSKILANCTEKLGTLPRSVIASKMADELTIVDRYKLMISLRMVTVGSVVNLSPACKKCSVVEKISVDLNDIEIKEAPTAERRFSHKVRGVNFVWERPTGRDERWSLSLEEKGRDSVATVALLQRLREIDGVPLLRGTPRNDADAMRRVKALSFNTRNDLRKVFKEHESSINDTIEHKCSNCRHENEFALEFDMSFFYQ